MLPQCSHVVGCPAHGTRGPHCTAPACCVADGGRHHAADAKVGDDCIAELLINQHVVWLEVCCNHTQAVQLHEPLDNVHAVLESQRQRQATTCASNRISQQWSDTNRHLTTHLPNSCTVWLDAIRAQTLAGLADIPRGSVLSSAAGSRGPHQVQLTPCVPGCSCRAS